MEPNVAEDEQEAENGEEDVSLDSLLEDDVVDEPTIDASVHVFVLRVAAGGHLSQCLVELGCNGCLSLWVVLNIFEARFAVLNRPSLQYEGP